MKLLAYIAVLVVGLGLIDWPFGPGWLDAACNFAGLMVITTIAQWHQRQTWKGERLG